jgi:dephospho-CoA kinase
MTVNKRSCIIVSGLPNTGKSAAVNYIANRGYNPISAGDYLRKQCKTRGLLATRENCEILGTELLATIGYGGFADMLLALCDPYNNIVIDGIRPLETIEHIKIHEPHTTIIYIESDELKRASRAILKGESDLSFQRSLVSPMELLTLNIKPVADFVIMNNNSLAWLYEQLEKLPLGLDYFLNDNTRNTG